MVFRRTFLFAAVICTVFTNFRALAERANYEKVWIVDIDIEGAPNRPPIADGLIVPFPALYDAGIIRRVVAALSRFYSENGYPYNKITALTRCENSGVCDEEQPMLSARFIVNADERVCSGDALIGGDERSRKLYLKDVRVVAGRLYNVVDADETVRRLSMRGYVRAAAALSPVIIEDAPLCGDSLRVAVVPFAVTENRGMSVEGAIGYESGRGKNGGAVSGRLDLSFVNMLRRGETVDISYAGLAATQKLKISAERPWAFGLSLDMGGSIDMEVEDESHGFFGGSLSGALELDARYRYGAVVRASETVLADEADSRYGFYGVDIFFSLIPKPRRRGRVVWEFTALTGSGVANREKSYNRSDMELTAGIHLPISSYALVWRAVAKSLFTDEAELSPAEMYRVGGYGSLRGYFDEEFAFRFVAYSQIEAIYYISAEGSIYVFVDGGAGFRDTMPTSLLRARAMLGYGAGLRFPSRLGEMSVEWARNVSDGWSGLGRVHVGIRIK